MPRSQRQQAPGGIYHLTTRGVRRTTLYRDTHDYELFQRLFGWVATDGGWHVIAYCWMPNHYHALVETIEPNLSAGMHRLNFRYAVSFNDRYGLTGHVFERRFRSRVIEDDEDLVHTARYVVLNPVRARLCSNPGLWRWSSYLATLGRVPSTFLRPHRLDAYFGGDPAAYAAFVAEGIDR